MNTTTLPSYFGGKSGNGVYQAIINQIPPHHTYIETHLGHGGILRHKRPALHSIGIEIDSHVIAQWANHTHPSLALHHGDAVAFLHDYELTGTEFIYVDPPYLLETRKSTQRYPFDYTTEQHCELLKLLQRLTVPVAISGYWSDLYAEQLADWRYIQFPSVTRGGTVATETLWMNYDPPKRLHDYRYLGNDYRERERLGRKTKRWIERLNRLPELERQALLSAIYAIYEE